MFHATYFSDKYFNAKYFWPEAPSYPVYDTPSTRTYTVLTNAFNPYFNKDAGSVLDFEFDFSGELAQDTSIISSITLTKKGTPEFARTATYTSSKVSVWLSGGTPGEICYLTINVTTDKQRTFSQTKPIRIA